jgi:hypothetical protein
MAAIIPMLAVPVVAGVMTGVPKAGEAVDSGGEAKPVRVFMSERSLLDTGFGWAMLRPEAEEVSGGGIGGIG